MIINQKEDGSGELVFSKKEIEVIIKKKKKNDEITII